jgi:Endonuclease I
LQAITWPPSAQGDFELQDHRMTLQPACELSTGQAHPADQPLACQSSSTGPPCCATQACSVRRTKPLLAGGAPGSGLPPRATPGGWLPVALGAGYGALAWHEADPVDELERRRHERIVETQGNRNCFIDRPEFSVAIWGNACGVN